MWNAFQRLNNQGLFSVTFENWYLLWEKYHISLFLVCDLETTDPSFWLFFLVDSFGVRKLIRKRVWTLVRSLFFLYWFIWSETKISTGSSRQIQKRRQSAFSQTDRLPFSLMTDFSRTFFFYLEECTFEKIQKGYLDNIT